LLRLLLKDRDNVSRILIAVILLTEGVAVQQGGTVTGVLRDNQNMPVSGIRMAAIARSDALIGVSSGIEMARIAVTDEEGRFTLENIPPGRYVIGAGRLDLCRHSLSRVAGSGKRPDAHPFISHEQGQSRRTHARKTEQDFGVRYRITLAIEMSIARKTLPIRTTCAHRSRI
jgi:hypothetical protein